MPVRLDGRPGRSYFCRPKRAAAQNVPVPSGSIPIGRFPGQTMSFVWRPRAAEIPFIARCEELFASIFRATPPRRPDDYVAGACSGFEQSPARLRPSHRGT